jgi:hypothetical protein
MSATRVLEARHNLNKFQKNLEGRKSLGTTAINNKLNPVLNSSAAKLPVTYKETLEYDKATNKYKEGSRNYKTRIFLPHNTITIDGITYISLSNNYAVDNIANIGTSSSHKLNGTLDVGKDDWTFNIQSNPQIEPISTHLSEAGVPISTYIYFISNPLVRQYAEKQRIYNSPYARFTGNVLASPAFAKYQSSKDVLEQYIPELIEKGLQNAPEEVFVNYYTMKPYTDQFGEEKEMRQYISKMMSKSDLMNQIDAGIIDMNKITVISKDKSGQYGYRNAYYVNPVPTNKNFYDLSTYYSSLPSVLNSKGEFDLKKMKDIVENPDDSKYLYDKVAMFIHFLELEKQVKGVDSLKRQMNPDTKTSKTMQEVVRRNVSLEELNDMSKLDPETKRRATEESVLAPFFDNSLIEDLVKQVFPFRNTDKITDYIVKVLRTNYGDITKKYGYGQDGVSKFITNFKNSVANYVYQNNMPDLFDPEGNLITFSNMTGSNADSYTSKLFDMIKKHLRGNKIKRTYPILEQLTIINTKGKPSQRSITLNDRADLKGSLADIYYNNLKDLANPNIKKVTNPDVNNYISQMFALLPQISMYLNGQGYSPYGINNALPFDEYVSIMERSSGEFLSEQVNEDVLNTVYKKLMKDYSVFKNYKAEPLVESLPADVPAFTPDLLDVETSEDVLPTAEDFETGELVTRKTFTVETPSLQEISPTQPTVQPIKQFENSLFRGQENEPVIDANGNLVLVSTYDSLFKSEGVSFAEDLDMARGYGLRYSKNPYIIEIDADYADTIFPLDKSGGTKSYGKRVVGDQGEQRFVSKEDVIIPKGKFKITRKERTFNFETFTPEQLIEAYNKQFTETDIAEYNRYGEVSTGYATEGSDYYDAIEKELLRRGISKNDFLFLRTANAIFSIEEIVADAYNIKTEPGELTPDVSKEQIQEFLNKQLSLIDTLKKVSVSEPVKEITPPIPGGKNKLLSDADIERFNLEVARNNNLLPKTFTTSSADQDAFANDISGKKPGSEEYNLWQLNPRGLYNLVDVNTGEIYLRDVDLATGFQKEQVAPSTPVDEKLLKDTIKDLTDGIKEYRLDQIFALKGYDINDIIKKLENTRTQEELIDTIVLIKKITC